MGEALKDEGGNYQESIRRDLRHRARVKHSDDGDDKKKYDDDDARGEWKVEGEAHTFPGKRLIALCRAGALNVVFPFVTAALALL